MSYKSDINLRLSEVPKTSDPAIFPDMVEIYNAIHILGQYLDAVAKNSGSGDEDTPPWEAMPFRNYFYTEAARSITAGSVVTMISYDKFSNEKYGRNPYSINGLINGAAGSFGVQFKVHNGTKFFGPNYGGITGMALTDAEPGQLVRVGVGPAIMKMEGIELGEPVFALASYIYYPPANFSSTLYAKEVNDGKLFKLPKEGGIYQFESQVVTVGRGVARDSMMFCPPEHGWTSGITQGADTSSNESGGGGDN